MTDERTPEPLRLWGFPTILINGVDVGGGRPSGSSCRLYPHSENPGAPSDAMIDAALGTGGILAAMKVSRSRGRTRMELVTRTWGSSPSSQSRYTVALQTPSCSATSATRSSRLRPPYRTARSTVVGVVATRGAVPGANPKPEALTPPEA